MSRVELLAVGLLHPESLVAGGVARCHEDVLDLREALVDEGVELDGALEVASAPEPEQGGQTGAIGSHLRLAEDFGVKEGVLVKSVADDSVAKKTGLKAGDVITSVNGRHVYDSSDVTRAIVLDHTLSIDKATLNPAELWQS